MSEKHREADGEWMELSLPHGSLCVPSMMGMAARLGGIRRREDLLASMAHGIASLFRTKRARCSSEHEFRDSLLKNFVFSYQLLDSIYECGLRPMNEHQLITHLDARREEITNNLDEVCKRIAEGRRTGVPSSYTCDFGHAHKLFSQGTANDAFYYYSNLLSFKDSYASQINWTSMHETLSEPGALAATHAAVLGHFNEYYDAAFQAFENSLT